MKTTMNLAQAQQQYADLERNFGALRPRGAPISTGLIQVIHDNQVFKNLTNEAYQQLTACANVFACQPRRSARIF